MRRKVSLGVRRYFASRKKATAVVASAPRPASRPARSSPSRAVSVYRPRSVRRSARHSSAGSFGGSNPLKNLTSKDTLKVAGGAVGAGLVSEYVLAKWGDKLPGAQSSQYGQTLYRVAVPLGVAYFVRRWDRRVADGFIVGAAVLAINDIIRHVKNNSTSFERMGLAGELSRFGNAPSPARLKAIQRVQAARAGRVSGFRGTVEELTTAPSSPAFSRSAF